MCMYMYAYVHIYMCVHVCVHVCVHICMYVYVCVWVVPMLDDVRLRVRNDPTNVCACVCAYIYMCVHVCVWVVPMLDDVRLRVRNDPTKDAAKIRGSRVAWVDSLTSSSCLYISCPGGTGRRRGWRRGRCVRGWQDACGWVRGIGRGRECVVKTVTWWECIKQCVLGDWVSKWGCESAAW